MIHRQKPSSMPRFAVIGASATLALLMAGPVLSQDATAKPETTMTPQQTKELFKSVDEIAVFVSQDSHLKLQHSIKRQMMSRAQVNSFLVKQFHEDKSAKRMEQSELVLKKFGLLDRDFHLRPFLISLLTEQIAGFYDAKTRTIHMLDWVGPDEQKPVLAHELTHALQDQHVDMTKWSDPAPENVSTNAREDRQHIQMDETNTAREAVAEGQAMVVFIDYALQPSGKTLATAPEFADRMREMDNGTAGSPIMARAPLLLQQALLFPYTEGLSFEQKVLLKAGIDQAFAGALDHPPSSSREILHPDEYLAHTPVPVLAMPDIHPLLDKEWQPYDIGVMGEMDVSILTELFGGKPVSKWLAPEWDGGIYYAAQRKAASPAEKATTASLALVYYSQWKSEDAASKFLRVYASQLSRKYRGVKQVAGNGDAATQIYSTAEGDVVLTLHGNGVFVSEGFDRNIAAQLDEMFRGAQGSGPIRSAQRTVHDPAMDLSHQLAGFGLVKAAMPSMAEFAK